MADPIRDQHQQRIARWLLERLEHAVSRIDGHCVGGFDDGNLAVPFVARQSHLVDECANLLDPDRGLVFLWCNPVQVSVLDGHCRMPWERACVNAETG